MDPASTLGLAGTAASSPPALALAPDVVHPGQTVRIYGSADGCPAGDTVFVLSRAFPHTSDFAGVPAALATVRADGTFRARTTIPQTKKPGWYRVTARCGGGNLGVLAHVTVKP